MKSTLVTTPTPFRFDGHGINDAQGQRICKVCSCEPYIYGDGRAVRNPEFDRLSNLFAAAPDMLKALERGLSYINHDEGREPSGLRLMDVIELFEAAIREAKGE